MATYGTHSPELYLAAAVVRQAIHDALISIKTRYNPDYEVVDAIDWLFSDDTQEDDRSLRWYLHWFTDDVEHWVQAIRYFVNKEAAGSRYIQHFRETKKGLAMAAQRIA